MALTLGTLCFKFAPLILQRSQLKSGISEFRVTHCTSFRLSLGALLSVSIFFFFLYYFTVDKVSG